MKEKKRLELEEPKIEEIEIAEINHDKSGSKDSRHPREDEETYLPVMSCCCCSS